jgi:collagenase-like PrtC family protease
MAGKEVVLSTQVLLESGAEVGTMHKITGNGDFLVEANDMGAVQCLAGKVPFVAGPHLNIYNLPTLQWMAWAGRHALGHSAGNEAQRLGRDSARSCLQGMQTEVFAYGRMPLAFSARCFTARHRNLPKDDCRFSCLDHPDGLMLKTREHEEFLVLERHADAIGQGLQPGGCAGRYAGYGCGCAAPEPAVAGHGRSHRRV